MIREAISSVLTKLCYDDYYYLCSSNIFSDECYGITKDHDCIVVNSAHLFSTTSRVLPNLRYPLTLKIILFSPCYK